MEVGPILQIFSPLAFTHREQYGRETSPRIAPKFGEAFQVQCIHDCFWCNPYFSGESQQMTCD